MAERRNQRPEAPPPQGYQRPHDSAQNPVNQGVVERLRELGASPQILEIAKKAAQQS